jgi:hypothetical protein
MTSSKIKSIAARLGLAAVLALMALALPAQSAEPAAPAAPVFPPASRIGIVPPPGMALSKTFPGFVDPDKNAGILISALPAGAYADMEKTLSDDGLKQRGITVEKREPMQLGIGKGELVIGTQLSPDKTPYRKWLLLIQTTDLVAAVTVQAPQGDSAYTDSIVHAALASLVLRTDVPEAEFLNLLPFKVGDFAGFHIGNVIPGRALLLVDAPKTPHMVVTEGLPEFELDARCIIMVVPGGPTDPEQRSAYARDAFDTIGGIKDIQTTMAEPVNINNEKGFETVASAKDTSTGAPLMVVQWLRFGGTNSLQMVGISRADIWDTELSRLRAMRDSIQMK